MSNSPSPDPGRWRRPPRCLRMAEHTCMNRRRSYAGRARSPVAAHVLGFAMLSEVTTFQAARPASSDRAWRTGATWNACSSWSNSGAEPSRSVAMPMTVSTVSASSFTQRMPCDGARGRARTCRHRQPSSKKAMELALLEQAADMPVIVRRPGVGARLRWRQGRNMVQFWPAEGDQGHLAHGRILDTLAHCRS